VSDGKSKTVASKWNARYAYSNHSKPEPADVLVKCATFLPASGIAIDIACGLGGNAAYLANKGFKVFAWDISSEAIDNIRSPNITTQVRDVVSRPPEPESADVIVVSRFLDRDLCPHLFTAGLSNPDYMLAKNELPALLASLIPCHVYESEVDDRGFSEAQFVGRKKQD